MGAAAGGETAAYAEWGFADECVDRRLQAASLPANVASAPLKHAIVRAGWNLLGPKYCDKSRPQ